MAVAGPLQQHFCNVYAFCRWADDLGDETGDPERALQLLSWWRSETEDCYRGITRHPVFVALRETIEQFELPAEPFLDLISAFEQDQHVTEYETFDQLRDYCRRSADPVGRIILRLGGCYNEQTVAWSDSICTGLQLANFWQDVGRDLEIGRIYLPAEDRDRFGYPRDALDRRQTSPEFLDLMRFEVDRARQWLLDGVRWWTPFRDGCGSASTCSSEAVCRYCGKSNASITESGSAALLSRSDSSLPCSCARPAGQR